MTALVIRAPQHRMAEFAWVTGVIFGRWLGLTYRIEPHDGSFVDVQAGSGCVRWSDVFFAQADACWLQAESLPKAPLTEMPLLVDEIGQRTGHAAVAQLFGDGQFECGDKAIHLPVDITGSAFFLLSRYEEGVAGAAQDRHGRFPGTASAIHRAGWALRPLVDEWVELLWWALQRVAPELQRRPRSPRVWVSCDVDAPYSPGAKSLALAARQTASDLVNHRSLRQAGRTLLNAAASRLGITRFDPFDTFDWMLRVNERAGHQVTFFFLSVKQPARIDGCYELDEPRVASLIGEIASRGHEVGLHGSYHSVDMPSRLAVELEGLRDALTRAGSAQEQIGSRQHYLRWRIADTARALDSLGVSYDSSLGFPDTAGFRCGTCHSFPLFDLHARQALSLLERPLVLMEATVISKAYLGLGLGDEAYALMMGLRRSCMRFDGEFSLLWHNSAFTEPAAREIYEALIQPL